MNKFLTTTCVAAAGLALFGLATFSSAQAETTLVVVSWGGAYTASQQKAYHEPYMKLNPDIKILNDDSSSEGLSKMRAMQEAGNVTWDLVDVVAADAIVACDEGLVLEIDHDALLAPAPDGTPASKDFFEGFAMDCFIPEIVYSTTFGYRTDKVGDTPPTSIADVFNLKKFPGKRSLEKKPIGNLEWALLADGVPVEKIYDVLSTPEGLDQAFAKLDTIKDQVVWWVKGAVPTQLLADGEVIMASAYNGRLFSAIVEEKQPIGMMWEWQVFDLDGWVIPVGGKNEEAVKTYVRWATDTQRLADQAKFISYGPARQSSAPLVGKHATLGIDMGPHMPTNPKNAEKTLMFNYVWWADNRAELDERFQAWLAK